MTKCQKCGADISFVRMKSGALCPVNPTRVFSKDCTEKAALVHESGVVQIVIPGQSFKYESGFISHFATCPAAKDCRKKRKSK